MALLHWILSVKLNLLLLLCLLIRISSPDTCFCVYLWESFKSELWRTGSWPKTSSSRDVWRILRYSGHLKTFSWIFYEKFLRFQINSFNFVFNSFFQYFIGNLPSFCIGKGSIHTISSELMLSNKIECTKFLKYIKRNYQILNMFRFCSSKVCS